MHGRITGHVRVEQRSRAGRVWIATYVRADGTKTRKTLGPAWVRESGKRTPRGAILWRAANGSKPDTTYLTPKDAEEALDALLAVERKKPASARRVTGKTLGDAATSWLEHGRTVRGIAPTTLAGYEVIVGRIYAEEFPRDLLLSRITAARVTGYQSKLLKRLGSPARKGKLGRESIRRRMVVLRRILKHAVALGWIATNPSDGVELVAQPAAQPDFNVLEPSQVEAVARAMTTVPPADLPTMRNGKIDKHALAVMQERRTLWADAVRVAAYTGLRFGELRALRWRDIDFTGEAVRVLRHAPTSAPAGNDVKTPKSERGRSVPLIPQAVTALDRVSKLYPNGPDDLVFPTRGVGMLEAGRVRDAFYEGLKQAKLGHVRAEPNPMTFHDLRHTFGSIAVRVFPVSDVQAMLGHADIATTMRYVHSVPRTDAAAKLASAFGSDLNPADEPAAVA
ncbi:MAG: site-specific integrase [Solirubrobacterales bacterium]|nr:site-specific integrase [Solirubrobacterales bacterium]